MNKLLVKYEGLSKEVKAGIWFACCNFINKGISMIVVPVYTRILTTEEYGEYAVFQSWLNIFVIIATLEISRGHYKVGIIKYQDDVSEYTSSVLGLGSFFTLIILSLYFIDIPFFNHIIGLSTPIMLCMFGYLFVYPAWEFWTIKQRFAYQYRSMVYITILIAVLTPVLGVISILMFHLKGDAVIYSKLLVQFVVSLILYIIFFVRGKKAWNKTYWKEVFIFNIALIPYLLSTIVLNQADRIMIKNMIGTTQAAIYSVAYSVAVIFQLFNTAISDAIVPWMYKKLKAGSVEQIEPINDRLLILVAVINLILILFAPEVIKIFAPAQYYEAIWIIPPVTASVFFVFIVTRYVNVEIYYEASTYISIVSVLIAFLNIILNYICIKEWGYLAAGYTTLFSYVVFCITHYFVLKNVCKIKGNGIQIFKAKKTVLIALVFLAFVFIIMSVYDYSIIRYSIALLLCLYFYKKKEFIKWIIKSKKLD